MDWTESKQRALESYIRSYLSTLSDPTKLYEGLNWKKIATLTGLEPENDTALFKIDELYDEYLIQIQGNTPKSWQGPHNSVWVEAEEAVAGLRLEANNEPAQLVSESVAEPPKQPSRPPLASEARARRGSLNLIERPLGFKNGPTYKRSESKALLTTAETSTTNVNVITRSEIGFRAAREVPKKPQILNLIQQVLSRLKHLVKKRSNSKLDVSEPISTMERQRRRLSVVGMNLPLYIRRQLQEEAESHQNELEIQSSAQKIYSALVEPDTIPGHLRSTSESQVPPTKERVVQEPDILRKKLTRLQNLLSNSQSLYLRSSDGAQSPDPFADSEVEAQDKEYILPNLLTRFYNDDSDSNDEVLRALDDDDVDFVNLHESEDELRAIQEDDDRDDDYLFKI